MRPSRRGSEGTLLVGAGRRGAGVPLVLGVVESAKPVARTNKAASWITLKSSFGRNDRRHHNPQTLKNRRANWLGEALKVDGTLFAFGESIPADKIRAASKELSIVGSEVCPRHAPVASSALGDLLEVVMGVSVVIIELRIPFADLLLIDRPSSLWGSDCGSFRCPKF